MLCIPFPYLALAATAAFRTFLTSPPLPSFDGFCYSPHNSVKVLFYCMLVYSERSKIELLPALPKEWPSGVIEGVLCRGQIEIKRLKWDDRPFDFTQGRQVELSLVSQIPQNVTIKIPRGFKEVKITKGDADIVENRDKQGECVVAVVPGEVAEIHFVR